MIRIIMPLVVEPTPLSYTSSGAYLNKHTRCARHFLQFGENLKETFFGLTRHC